MVDVISDLFGNPVLPRKEGKGRPAHQWTQENSNKINLIFACGGDLKTAATAIGLSIPTLWKHYFHECAGRAAADMKMLGLQLYRLDRAAAAGNVAAEKALRGLIQSERVRALSDRIAGRQKDKPAPRVAPMGKKDQATADAKGVIGKFAPPPAPSLLN